MLFHKHKKMLAMLPAAVAILLSALISSPVKAGILHRHPAAAGAAAHHMLKHK